MLVKPQRAPCIKLALIVGMTPAAIGILLNPTLLFKMRNDRCGDGKCHAYGSVYGCIVGTSCNSSSIAASCAQIISCEDCDNSTMCHWSTFPPNIFR